MVKCGLSNGRKFLVLAWKTLISKKRHYIETILDILVPSLLFIVLVVLRFLVGDLSPKDRPAQTFPNDDIFQSIRYQWPLQLCGDSATNGQNRLQLMLYTPDNQATSDLAAKWNETLFAFHERDCSSYESYNFEFRGMKDEDAIVSEFNLYQLDENDYETPNVTFVLAGVVFEDLNYDNEGKLSNLKYKIRMDSRYVVETTNILFPLFEMPGPGENEWNYAVFSMFQTMIDYAYIELQTNKSLLPKSKDDWENVDFWPTIEKMPYPFYKETPVAFVIGFMAFFTVLSYTFIIPPIMKRVVQEKKSGARELMRMMGLPSWMNWLFHFIDAMGSIMISLVIIIILISVEWKSGQGKVLDFSNPFIVYVFLVFYSMSLVTFLFALSTLFNNPNLALTGGIVVHLIGYMISAGNITDEVYTNMSGGAKILLTFYPNIGFWWGIKSLMHLEGMGEGAHWNNLFHANFPGDPITMGVVWVLFIVNIVFYAFLTWYIDSIKPGPYGVAKKWYFLFTKSYWMPASATSEVSPLLRNGSELRSKDDRDLFEAEPNTINAGVIVNGLRKEFKGLKGRVLAVDAVTFKAYEGQITALLGHNGAGKTTTMSMLTGMLAPSSGSASINGFDIGDNMNMIRKSLGLCPQHNMLFVDMTVEEHMIFFGMLKGVSMTEAKRQTSTYIAKLDLVPKTRVLADKLSGGMKRKLHLGIALIGDSSVVMLDEPTSGMDPEARRHMWDLLQEIKKERTILLTTHFMEEADVLGDRVVIMSHGRAKCNGSPLFLKRVLGDGYTLSMTKGENCDVKATSKLIKDCIHGVSLTVTKNELIFNMPVNEVANFPALFEQLDKSIKDLDVYNISIKVATMEDVFLKVGEMSDEDDGAKKEDENPRRLMSRQSTIVEAEQQAYQGTKRALWGLSLIGSQFFGLLKKRFIYSKRRYLLFGILGLAPMVLSILTMTLSNGKTNRLDFEPLELNANTYTDPYYYYTFGNDSDLKGWTDSYGLAVGVEDGRFVKTNDFEKYLLDRGAEDISLYRNYPIAGASFQVNDSLKIGDYGIELKNVTELRAYYNSVPLHSYPISLNLMSNAILKHFDVQDRSISTTNHPFSRENAVTFQDIADNNAFNPDAFFNSLAFVIGLSLFASAFLLFPLVERIPNAKQVQLMTGVNPFVFWGANLFWDFSLFFLSSLLLLIMSVALDTTHTYTTNGAAGSLVLIMIMYGLSAIPLSYVISFLAKSPASGFTMIIILNVLAGCIAPIAAYVLKGLGSQPNAASGLELAGDIVRYIFSFFPVFDLAYSFIGLSQTQTSNNLCINAVDKQTLTQVCTEFANPTQIDPNEFLNKIQYFQCCKSDYVDDPKIALCGTVDPSDVPFVDPDLLKCHETKSFFTWDQLNGLNINLIWMFVCTIIYMGILFLIESGIFKTMINSCCRRGRFSNNYIDHTTLDEDVLAERERVSELIGDRKQTSDAFLVKDLKKEFGIGRKFLAVDHLTFGVKNGECFGLLGVNGAGKTTSFRMLTGDEIMSGGTATLLGSSIMSSRSAYLSKIGYCPQFDSIIDVMTGREMLELFARLRGMRPGQIAEEVNYWLEEVGIMEYADRKCGTYSGGNKRKLNVAQALVADPPIIFLDEPSSGVDPASRRKLWKIIRNVQKKGQSIILTSHSMEECDELCGRLGIMVNGQFQCFGPTRYLKNKFGQGFTILSKLDTQGQTLEQSMNTMEAFKRYIMSKFDGCVVKDEHKDYVHFHVTNPYTPWAHLFSTMERAKQEFACLTDYSVSETTLEQVFLSFAKEQRKRAGES